MVPLTIYTITLGARWSIFLSKERKALSVEEHWPLMVTETYSQYLQCQTAQFQDILYNYNAEVAYLVLL